MKQIEIKVSEELLFGFKHVRFTETHNEEGEQEFTCFRLDQKRIFGTVGIQSERGAYFNVSNNYEMMFVDHLEDIAIFIKRLNREIRCVLKGGKVK